MSQPDYLLPLPPPCSASYAFYGYKVARMLHDAEITQAQAVGFTESVAVAPLMPLWVFPEVPALDARLSAQCVQDRKRGIIRQRVEADTVQMHQAAGVDYHEVHDGSWRKRTDDNSKAFTKWWKRARQAGRKGAPIPMRPERGA